MTVINHVHGKYVHSRRVRVLNEYLSALIPEGARVLDVGCGDGMLASLLSGSRPDLEISGVDVLVRDNTRIPVREFDGKDLPLADNSVDVVMFVDVLHHTDDPAILLREAARVATTAIAIKDHTRNGLFAGATLRMMDWIGNSRHGVNLPYNYWAEQKWLDTFHALGVSIAHWNKELRLYPRPASWLFDRSLHFLTLLDLKKNRSNFSQSERRPDHSERITLNINH